MRLLLDAPWLAAAVPVALAAIVAAGGSRLAPVTRWVAALGPLAVLLTGLAHIAGRGEGEAASPFVGGLTASASVPWIEIGGRSLDVGYAVDGLTSIMLVVVGFVALMVMVFSVGYMAGDRGLARYYAVLSLFTASMTGLVLADGLVGLFIAWELVGVCSYLLIGFWFEKPTAAAAAMKAFLVTRVGDVGLFVALALLWGHTGETGYTHVMAALPDLAPWALTAAALLLFVGAAGKSAQFPLHIWLPDAMAGPTPVSALIHAATMVAAGVFLVARTWPLFEASSAALTVILGIGAFTALASATIALGQHDIKKVLAYSTISQLGFMFAALGAGVWRAAMFHLVTHAAFKALLFLGSGSVIHGTDSQDMREMGGLARRMPFTAVTWVIGAAALAGLPPLSGFFSKDEVVHGVLGASTAAGAALLVAAAFTAFYITRATVLTFFGEYRGNGHPHESGPVMWLPLVALAVPAAVLGAGAGGVAELLGGHEEAISLPVAAASVAVALTGIAAGSMLYRRGPEADDLLEARLGTAWSAARNAYGVDAAVGRFVVEPVLGLSRMTYAVLDRLTFDGIAEGSASVARSVGRGLARLQSGDGQWYAALMGAGVIALIALTTAGSALETLLGWIGR
ncbi:MAG: NADH-quinone oxidoreductase subunit L [Coriobacteriia bacterium]|nr:NADH-quinone oxidoreductase subunit L [Coriobacteriia bacterium]